MYMKNVSLDPLCYCDGCNKGNLYIFFLSFTDVVDGFEMVLKLLACFNIK